MENSGGDGDDCPLEAKTHISEKKRKRIESKKKKTAAFLEVASANEKERIAKRKVNVTSIDCTDAQ